MTVAFPNRLNCIFRYPEDRGIHITSSPTQLPAIQSENALLAVRYTTPEALEQQLALSTQASVLRLSPFNNSQHD